jgi:hypothetical protein
MFGDEDLHALIGGADASPPLMPRKVNVARRDLLFCAHTTVVNRTPFYRPIITPQFIRTRVIDG